MNVRLRILKNKKPKQYALANKYFNFLGKRTKLEEKERYKLSFERNTINTWNIRKLKMFIQYIIETGITMLLHSVIIGILLYLFMVFILGQKQNVAENRSILLASFTLVYMILFGHGLPTSLNKNLF